MRRTESSYIAGLALLFVGSAMAGAPPSVAGAATLSMPSNGAPAGSSVDMCVVLSDSERQIAGIQANILFDARCANVIRGSGNSAECTIGPAAVDSEKQIRTSIGGAPCGNNPNCVFSIVLSFDNTDPIDDGTLFCCAFTIPASAPNGDCVFQFSKVIGAKSGGRRIDDISTRPGILVVSGGSSRSSGSGGGIGNPLAGGPPVAAGGAEPVPPAEPAAGQPAPSKSGADPAAPGGQKGALPTVAAAPFESAAAEPTAAPAAPETGDVPSRGATGAPPTVGGPLAPALPPRTEPAQTPAVTPTGGSAPASPTLAAAEVAATPTRPAPTRTPTLPLPTTTPTAAGGWFSGCHLRR